MTPKKPAGGRPTPNKFAARYDWQLTFARSLLDKALQEVTEEQKRTRSELSGGGSLSAPRPRLPRDLLDILEYSLRSLTYLASFNREDAATHCCECGKKLPRGKRRFCSKKPCSNRFFQRQHREERWLETAVKKSALLKAKVPSRPLPR